MSLFAASTKFGFCLLRFQSINNKMSYVVLEKFLFELYRVFS